MDNAFRVDPVQGTIEVATALDQRRTSEYILTVRASDAGQPPRHADVHVNIVVTLPDNAPPRFEKVSRLAAKTWAGLGGEGTTLTCMGGLSGGRIVSKVGVDEDHFSAF